MAKANNKTAATKGSVDGFIATIKDEGVRDDCQAIIRMMKKATGADPKMWGTAIIGFGDRHLKYESGREMDWFITGFSPRKQNLTLYLGLGGVGQQASLLKKLGKHSTGKGCLYIKRLADVDTAVLQELITAMVKACAAKG